MSRSCRQFVMLFALLSVSVVAVAETILGRVVGVTDGDTLTVLDAGSQQHKIRLAGIDAPEKSQPFGSSSKQNLSDLAYGKSIAVEWSKQDRYGRTVGKVLVSGQDVNLMQVRAGMAWWYRDYAKEQSLADRRLYEQAEQQARAQHVGLWRDAKPLPPWDFRHGAVDATPKTSERVGEGCYCGSGLICMGPKGGRFCVTESGGKRYQ